MTEEEFESLRTWGEALGDDPRAEVRAAGRAIHLLAKEVERLQVELWHSRIGVTPAATSVDAHGDERGAPGAERGLPNELHSVFSRVARRLHPTRVFHRS